MGLVHNLLMQFSTAGSSKIEVFKTFFFDILTTQYDHPRYVKHVLGRIYVFFTLFGYWVRGGGGCPQGLVANPLMQFFARTAQNSTFPKLFFFDIVTTQYDHPRYVKHVSARIYVVFTLFWVCCLG